MPLNVLASIKAAIVTAADWAVANQPLFLYDEFRPDHDQYVPTPAHKIVNDCSMTAIWCCWKAGAPEPFPGAFAGFGDTQSFLTLEHIPVPAPGDFVVYGEGLPLSVQHMAVIVEAGSDPLTMSHGWSGEPAFVRVSVGCPAAAQGRVTFIRAYAVVSAPPAPPIPPVPPVPKEDDMGVIAISSGSIKGDWWIHGRNPCNVSPDQVQALLACNVPKVTLNDAELEVFTSVAWTEI